MKKLFTLVFAAMIFSAGFAQTCDTLFNLNSPLDTPIVYWADTTPSQGYISGNNEYGDLVKAEGFAAQIGDSLYSAVFYFGIVNINPQDSDNTVEIAAWDNTGTSYYGIPGAPGNLIDTTTVTLRQIALAVTSYSPLQVNFIQPAGITTDTIYVGVVLPTTLGDTIALYTNIVPPGPDGNGWEFEGSSINAWGSYNDDWEFTDGSLGNYIAAEICGTAATAVNTLSDNVNIKIFPNPANDQLNFEWNLNDAAEVDMYDITGTMLKVFNIQGTALNTFSVQDLAPGSYIIRVTDKQTNQQRSQLFTKID